MKTVVVQPQEKSYFDLKIVRYIGRKGNSYTYSIQVSHTLLPAVRLMAIDISTIPISNYFNLGLELGRYEFPTLFFLFPCNPKKSNLETRYVDERKIKSGSKNPILNKCVQKGPAGQYPCY